MQLAPIYGLAILSLIAGVFAVPATAEPLRSELDLLLREHPDLRRARNDAAAARARIEEARSAYLPRFELSGDSGAERTDDPTRRQAGLGAFLMRRDKLTLTATQNLFNGFRDEAGIVAAELGHIEQQMSLENTRQGLLFQGSNQYLDLMRNVRLIAVA